MTSQLSIPQISQIPFFILAERQPDFGVFQDHRRPFSGPSRFLEPVDCQRGKSDRRPSAHTPAPVLYEGPREGFNNANDGGGATRRRGLVSVTEGRNLRVERFKQAYVLGDT